MVGVTTSIHPPDVIDDLESAWSSWIRDAEATTLLDTPEYARFLLAEVPSNYDAGLVVARVGEDPVAIVPWRRQVNLLGVPTGAVFVSGRPPARPGYEECRIEASAALYELKPTPISVQLDLPCDVALGMPSTGRWSMSEPRSVVSLCTMRLGPSWEGFVEVQSARFRRHLRYALKQVDKDWVLDDVTHEAEWWVERANDMLEASINETQGYGSRRLIHLYARQRSIVPAFRGRGLRVFALRQGNHVASVMYGVRWRDEFYLIRQGNDLHPSGTLKESASLTMRAAAFRTLAGQGVRTVRVVGSTRGWPVTVEHHASTTFERTGPATATRRGIVALLNTVGKWRPVRVARSQITRIVPSLGRHAA
jgi:hypothetical protein